MEMDYEKAQHVIDIVQNYREANLQEFKEAETAALNSILSLMVTGVVTGLFSNNPKDNGTILNKLLIAFDMGYYSRSMKNK